jgi:hypothetical protein
VDPEPVTLRANHRRIVVHKLAPFFIALASCVFSSAVAQDRTKDDIDALRAQGYSVRMISPIFSQLVMLSLPKGFKTVFENTTGNQYTREAVLDAETVDQWSQMITVTGAKGLAANPDVSAQTFVERIASGFKGACPDTYSAKTLGARKISGRDAFVILAGCGTAPSEGTKHSESALLISIKGASDYYTIQWAERGPASNWPIVFDDAAWMDRFDKLNPIKICRLVPREALPYPSCVNQK